MQIVEILVDLSPLRGPIRDTLCAETIRRDRLDEIEAARVVGIVTADVEKRIVRRMEIVDAAWWIASQSLTLGGFVAKSLPRRK